MNSHKNIFLDLGSNMGMGFAELAPLYNIDEHWQIFGFEPNPHSYQAYLDNIKSNRFEVLKNKNIKLLNVAAWHKNETQWFRMESCSKELYDIDPQWKKFCDDINTGFIEGKNLDFIDFDLPATGGSCLDILYNKMQRPVDHAKKLKFSEPVKVTCIDFAEWLKDNISIEDRVICKIDIEGSEYFLLPHLIETGAIKYISEIIIEWHQWEFPEYISMTYELIMTLQKLGIKITNWK